MPEHDFNHAGLLVVAQHVWGYSLDRRFHEDRARGATKGTHAHEGALDQDATCEQAVKCHVRRLIAFIFWKVSLEISMSLTLRSKTILDSEDTLLSSLCTKGKGDADGGEQPRKQS